MCVSFGFIPLWLVVFFPPWAARLMRSDIKFSSVLIRVSTGASISRVVVCLLSMSVTSLSCLFWLSRSMPAFSTFYCASFCLIHPTVPTSPSRRLQMWSIASLILVGFVFLSGSRFRIPYASFALSIRTVVVIPVDIWLWVSHGWLFGPIFHPLQSSCA